MPLRIAFDLDGTIADMHVVLRKEAERLFAATERKKGLWRMQELIIANSPNGRLNHRVLGFGQDPAGEVYVGGTLNLGPSGATGKVFKLVAPSGKER